MFYLPRICEHCLNPACVAACPSGAMYKRAEDGIVLVDQDQCRGWRMCVSGCPYKKVYFNHKTGKAEKCTLCYPRLEVGLPTVCSETCVGRLRYLGLFLYDADRVRLEAATAANDQDLYEAQLSIMLDPHDPEVIAAARAEGIPDDWMQAARKSPVYALAKEYRVALPLHPEYRTMPMVWYIPPLSPVVDALRETGHDAESRQPVRRHRALRIPIQYLAELFTAGDPGLVLGSLATLAAMRSYMRDATSAARGRPIPEAVGMTGDEIYAMYRLLAIAKYDDRYVIPKAHAVPATSGGGAGLLARLRRRAGDVHRVRALRRGVRHAGAGRRGDLPRAQGAAVRGGLSHRGGGGRVNLLNWDGAARRGSSRRTRAT